MGWLLAEASITLREPKKEEATDDRSSLELYAAARCVTVLGTVLSPPMEGTVSVRWALLAAGVTIMILGVGLRPGRNPETGRQLQSQRPDPL